MLGCLVGDWLTDGVAVGTEDGTMVGLLVVGTLVGIVDGKSDGTSVVGVKVGAAVEGLLVGVSVAGTKTTEGLICPKVGTNGFPVTKGSVTGSPSRPITSCPGVGGSFSAYQAFENPSRKTSLGSSPVKANPSKPDSDGSMVTGMHRVTSNGESGMPMASMTLASVSRPVVADPPVGGHAPLTSR